MPLVVPKQRYFDGELVVALRTQALYGLRPLSATLALCIVITELPCTVLETHYGVEAQLNGSVRRQDLYDTEDWALEAGNVQVLGVVFGPLALDDPVAMAQYLKHVLDVIWDDLHASWHWLATRSLC